MAGKEKEVGLILRLKDLTGRGASSARKNIKGLRTETDKISKSTSAAGAKGQQAFQGLGAAVGSTAGKLAAFSTGLGGVTVAVAGLAVAFAPIIIGLQKLIPLLNQARGEWSTFYLANLQVDTVWKSMKRSIPVEEIKQYASALQGASTFGDDMILQGAKMLGTFPRITDDIFKRTMKIMVDFASFAAAQGMTIDAAATALGKTSMGLYGAVERTGITFSETTKKTKDFASALSDIAAQVGGQAVATISTWDGAVKQLSNSWTDLLKWIGAVETKILGGFLKPIITEVSELAKSLEKMFKAGELDFFIEQLKVIGDTFGQVLAYILAKLPEYAKQFQAWVESLDRAEIQEWAEKVTKAIYKIVVFIADFSSWIILITKETIKWGNALSWLFALMTGNMPALMAFQTWLNSGGKGKGTEDSLKDIRDAIKKTTDMFKKMQDDFSGDSVLGDGEKLTAGGFENSLKDTAKEFQALGSQIRTTIKDLTSGDFASFGAIVKQNLTTINNKIEEFKGKVASMENATTEELDKMEAAFEKLKENGGKALQVLLDNARKETDKLDKSIKKLEDRLDKIKQKALDDINEIGKSGADTVRELQRSTLDDEEKLAESIDFITSGKARADALAASGTPEGTKEALDILKEVRAEAAKLSQYQKVFDTAGDKTFGRDWGIGIVEDITGQMQDLRALQAGDEAAPILEEKDELTKKKEGYQAIFDEIKTQIDNLPEIKLDIDRTDWDAILGEMANMETVEVRLDVSGIEQIDNLNARINEVIKKLSELGGSTADTIHESFSTGTGQTPGMTSEAAGIVKELDGFVDSLDGVAKNLPDSIDINITTEDGVKATATGSVDQYD